MKFLFMEIFPLSSVSLGTSIINDLVLLSLVMFSPSSPTPLTVPERRDMRAEPGRTRPEGPCKPPAPKQKKLRMRCDARLHVVPPQGQAESPHSLTFGLHLL
ncbi:hypothetical protein FOXG_18587 [Fusarium oxysporum f. sp. lycopersici 4287]|uniref:Uncharacterized protein n=2 Tax=Fusarium oxysporum TaxID=5507 RepID=A0A0J9UNP9_FUSO4|nr:hypothetical protein FOXG_18587 [Fusarium oxysporum f. sp. lycopersici 4287]XP_018237807.1 hypothetical protein FOXG_18587 [Fusarium oxysporum f. sp. lycopersici 4287]EXK31304.1 hypothetical protein FOMG_13025 [Fusarium oxysporum f. sp. melonis 26406]EXK31305.1 hypothetical protein FOMG_13025 [Fusarium oxysporum f. sp. melonis 26406]EXK31306.1 hypothetical protein FOMG_13025 [Fusarium oxysporum f. sp. melonis 26406]KNA99760.1 hypothetical protein FOXG_18587 [Fusarium oxysporum f. sp. lycope